MRIRIYHVDDHEAFSRQLRGILEPHVEWLGASVGGETVVAELAASDAEVVLLDISLAGASGFEVARMIRETCPEVKIVFVTMHAADAYVEAALDAGASAYVLKRSVASEIVPAIEEAYRGGTFISPVLRRRRELGQS